MSVKYSLFFIVCIFNSLITARAQQNLRLWYRQPAKTWEECVPLGNGRLGAMPDGGITDENIVLNDITLWAGGPQDADKEDAYQYLPEIRELLFAGKIAEAEKLVNERFLCKGKGTNGGKGAEVPYGCFQVLGNLHLQYDYGTAPSSMQPQHYYRELSLDSAIAKCSYRINGVTYYREYFSSFSNDVILVRLSADQPGKINLTLSLGRPERYQTVVHGDGLEMRGQLNNGTDGKGMKYLARVKLKPDGGTLITGDSTLQLQQANSVIIYISAATDFHGVPYEEKVASLLKAAMDIQYDDELAAHVKAYQRLFKRASLSLDSRHSELPTDERLVAFAKDPSDNGLPALYFQYGRYLLISSTRAGLLPPNLQGLWANTVQTPWNGDYHLDINIEMNHWPLDITNLPMLNEPFYTLIKGMVKPGEKTAKAYYNSPGWVAYVNGNVWGYTSPGGSASWGASVSGSGWLCQLLWDHYAFTQDMQYLKEIYPVLKGAATFYLHSMVREPDNGWLVTAPSGSPENGFRLPDGKIMHITAGPTIDNQIIRELFAHVISASLILGTDTAFRRKLAEAKQQLPPNQVDQNGRLMEWLKPYEEMDPHHRHLSPLWGLYPGNEITPSATPTLAAAAKALLMRRGDLSTGWSLAWKISLWARLKDGNHAFKLLKDLLRPTAQKGFSGGGGTYPNLFDACPPFQIDGNFGGTAGIAEMLLQSHEAYIELLPALPDQWKEGSFKGLCVRGGGIVNAEWREHRLTSVEITGTVSNSFKIKVPGYVKKIQMQKDKNIKDLPFQGGFTDVVIAKGEKVHLIFQQKNI